MSRNIYRRLYSYGTTVSPQPPSGGGGGGGGADAGWVPRVRAMAADKTGIDTGDLGFVWWDFDKYVAGDWQHYGAGAVTPQTAAVGGVINMGNHGLYTISSIGFDAGPPGRLFAYARIANQASTADNVAFNTVGFCNAALTEFFGIGFIGSVLGSPTTNFALFSYHGGSVDVSIDTGITGGPTSMTELYMWTDGSLFAGQVDDNDPVSTDQTDLTTNTGGLFGVITENSGAFLGMYVDRLAFGFEPSGL